MNKLINFRKIPHEIFVGILVVIVISGLTYLINSVESFLKFMRENNNNILFIILFLICYIIFQSFRIKRILQTMAIKEFEVISDENTKFEGSSTYTNLIKNVNSSKAWIHNSWEKADIHFQYLKNSKWIAHTNLISENEAIYGGLYDFIKSFDISFPLDKIQEAYIYFVVDDYCTIHLNEALLCKDNIGIDKINIHDIRNFLRLGKNEIKFQIKNADFSDQFINNPHFTNSSEKCKLNPYGIRYRISIKHI